MAKSPFSSAGGGSADTSPYSEARARGGRCKADGGKVASKASIEKAEASSNPKTRKAAMAAEKKAGY